MGRIDRNEMFMRIAFVLSERGTCGRAKVGALIIRDGRIISTGYNGPVAGADHCNSNCFESSTTGCTQSVHAEANAIAYAARHGIAVEGATMFCTHAPCLKCAELIVNSGITSIVYRTPYRENEGMKLLHSVGVNVYYYPYDEAEASPS